jgi:hypothetical protein
MSSSTGATTPVWTPEAMRQLGMTTDVATAGAILGIGRSKAYELAKKRRVPRRNSAANAGSNTAGG